MLKAANVADSTCDRHAGFTIINYSTPPSSHSCQTCDTAFFFLLLAVFVATAARDRGAIEPSDLKPGLIATYRDIRDPRDKPEVKFGWNRRWH